MSTNPTQSVVIPVARCDDTAAPARQLIISGFHRSGTSLTTQALFNAGLVLGEKLVAPSPANPDGHFEDQDIVRLHDDILHSQHRTWYSTGQPNTPDPDQFQTRTDDIIQRYQRNRAATIWGFKDPRTCLFLDWWHNSLPNPAAVLIYRDYWSCYESLRHRQAQQIAHNPVFHKQSTFFWTDPLLPLQLWLDHNQALLNYAQRNPETSLIVSHQAIIEGFDLVRECNQRFALDLAPDQPTGIRKDNNRQRAPVRFSNNIPEELQRQLDNTQAELNTLAVAPQTHYRQCIGVGPLKIQDDFELRLHKEAVALEIPVHDATDAVAPQSAAGPVQKLLQQIETASQCRDSKALIALLDTVKQYHPTDIGLLINVAKALRVDGKLDEAEHCLLSARSLAPGNQQILVQLALIARSHNQPLKAVTLLTAALAQQPAHGGIAAQLAELLTAVERKNAAINLVVTALESQPESRPLLHQQIKLLMHVETTAELVARCQHMLKLYPDDIGTWTMLASAYLAAGNTKCSLAAQQQATILKLRSMKDYTRQIIQVVNTLPSGSERWSLQNRILLELQKLANELDSAENMDRETANRAQKAI